MSVSYITLPQVDGPLADQNDIVFPLVRATRDSVLANVVGSLQVAAAGTSPNQVNVRVGGDVANGFEGTDYVRLGFSGGELSREKAAAIQIASGEMINAMFYMCQSPSAGFVGSARLETVGLDTGERYTTVDRVKAMIGGITDSSQDDTIDEIIAGVSQLFDSYVGMPFAPQLRTELHDGWSFRNGIPLDRVPSEDSDVRSQMTVREDGTALVYGTDYQLDQYPSRMIWRMDGGGHFTTAFSPGVRNVEVNYWTRWNAIPSDVQTACTEESARRYQAINTENVDGNRIGITQRSPESGTSLSYSVDDLSPATLRMLDAYKMDRFV